MFKTLRATNLRGFPDTGQIPLTKLNIFLGPNSSGKSSLVRIPLLVKQTLEDPNADNCLLTDGPLVDFGSFQDLIFGHDISKSISLEFEFTEATVLDIARAHSLRHKHVPVFGSFEFAFAKRRKRIYLKRFDVKLTSAQSLIAGGCSAAGRLVAWHPWEGVSPTQARGNLFHFIPEASPLRGSFLYGSDKKLVDLFRLLIVYRRVWQERMRALIHLGPIRYTLERNYKVTGESPMNVGTRGENLLGVLFRDERRPTRQRRQLLKQLAYWLDEKFGFVQHIKLEPITKDRSIYALTGQDCGTGIKVNLSMTGFGISQVAPIIVQGFLSESGTCIVMEQPEIHLHPAAQAEIGDLLIEFARQGKQLFVETHSEHILLRIRNRIAHGMFPASDVKVFYVHETEAGSAVQPLDMDERGRFVNWPKGFFEEDYLESSSIAAALTSTP
jgi:hypothetical protein